jgi:hypothetical protein
METIPVISLGAAAFWIALAAVLIANGINGVRREKLRQETLLKLVERTGQLDEQTVKTLFPPPPPHAPHVFGPPPRQPDGRRGLKIFATIVLSIAVGLAIFVTILWQLGPPEIQDDGFIPVVPYAMAALIACFGIGLFVAARFVRPPPDERDRETSEVGK